MPLIISITSNACASSSETNRSFMSLSIFWNFPAQEDMSIILLVKHYVEKQATVPGRSSDYSKVSRLRCDF